MSKGRYDETFAGEDAMPWAFVVGVIFTFRTGAKIVWWLLISSAKCIYFLTFKRLFRAVAVVYSKTTLIQLLVLFAVPVVIVNFVFDPGFVM